MRLKQLKLAGFKSFANPTTFHFKHTITAIVGPNGCGKSNVIDAIRWVLGESSAKQLRGGAMSDVIFAGTQEKSAKSLASVELVFEHTQGDEHGKGGILHPLNLYHELAVRRQITKDGKSEYFINGTKCRRKDVIDIFLGTGLGARSYAVIEQGMIGRIIDADAKQLREFIEEASGVSRYQSRREETQKQLENARDNLARLHDIKNELINQQQRLEKQAKTAKKAQNYQKEIEEIDKQLFIDDYINTQYNYQQLSIKYQDIHQQYTLQQNLLKQLQQQHQDWQNKIYDTQTSQQLQQKLYQHHWQQQHELQTLLHHKQQFLENKQQRLQTIDETLQQLLQQEQALQQEQEIIQQQIHELPQQITKFNEEIANYYEEITSVQQQRQQITNQLKTINQEKQEQEKQLAIAENSIKNLQQQQENLNKKQQKQEKSWQQWQIEQEKIAKTCDITALENQLLHINTTTEKLENAILYCQEQLIEQTDIVTTLEQQYQQQQQQQQAWKTEQQTLQNLIEKQKQYLVDFKKVHHQSLPKLFNHLSTNQQSKKFITILDKLCNLFQYWSFSENLIDNFSQEFQQVFGEVGVILSKKSTTQQKDLHTFTLNSENWIPISQLIDFPKLAIFNKILLSNKPISLTEIQPLWENLPDGHWLCVQVLDGTLLWLGSQIVIDIDAILHEQQQKHPLTQYFSQQTRVDELQIMLDNQQPQLEYLQTNLTQANISLQEWQAQDQQQHQELIDLTKKKQQLITQQWQQKNIQEKLLHEKHRLDKEAKQLIDEQNNVINKKTEQQLLQQSIKQKLLNIQPILNQYLQERQFLDNQIQQKQKHQYSLEQQHNQLNTQLVTEQLKLENSRQKLSKINSEQQQLYEEQQQLKKDIFIETQSLPKLQEQYHQAHIQLDNSQQLLNKINQQLQHINQQQQNSHQQIEKEQQKLSILQEQNHTSYTDFILAKQMFEQINVQLAEKYAEYRQMLDVSNAPMEKSTRELLQQQQILLKNKLQKLGAVNHTAIIELEEIHTRLQPLTEQIFDLTESIEKLIQAIRQIDNQTKQLFMKMLNEVNNELNRLFVQVFGGGKAQLVLVENDKQTTDWQAGLELMAQPKGKKNSRLAVLSGGEKTLTALSLVFAIFKQQPAPFCVLDEVDAPLDDANVERFTHLISELAKEVQFIFISHNKLSMQVADELKGVTMPTVGVSKLVSVDLHEANTYLE